MSTKGDLTLRVPASCRPGNQDRTKRLFSESVEEYLDGLFRLQREVSKVTNGEIATYMCVSAGSATAMIKKLADLGLVHHVPYQGIRLTDRGMKIAMQLARAHRVLKRYFVDELDMPWYDVHELACKLEHYIPQDVIERMYQRLGEPKYCPHGNPIDPAGPDPSFRLQEAEAGELRVFKITDERIEFLQHLETLGLFPGVEFEAVGSTAIDNLIHLKVNGKDITVGKEVARHLWVVPKEEKIGSRLDPTKSV